MKKLTQILNLKENDIDLLERELLDKLQECFNLRMQLKLRQFKKNHVLRMTRRSIASIKYYLSKNKIICTNNVKEKERIML